ncbi:uncharacterized protein [Nicotiana sylvestris]|uniref:uncharacterized protein n=1 Tax=Nicotiana sylvestris TaxID=4096 RepID=UPI00388C7A29
MVRRNEEMLKRSSSSKPKNYDLCHKYGKPGHFIKDYPLLKQEFSKNNPEKAAKRNPVPFKDFKRKRSADNVMKHVLAAWGDFSGEYEDKIDVGDSSMMAVEGKEIASKEHIRLENELKAVRTRICVETEKNKHLQTDLERVKNDLEKFLKWTWSLEAITAMYTNNGENRQGIGFQREKTPYNPHNKYVIVSDNWFCTHCGNNGTSKKIVRPGFNLFRKIKWNSERKRLTMICDKGNKVEFLSKICTVTDLVTGEVVLVAKRYKNIYVVDLESLQSGDLSCLKAIDDDVELWHKRLGHTSFSLLNKLIPKDLVHGLPMSKFKVENICDACAIGKYVKSSFKSKKDMSTSKPLELLHMDLCGPMRVFVAFVKKIQVKIESRVACIRSNHGTEFDNAKFDEFCNENGITHNFSAPRTPQQNGVVERKNRTLEEMAKKMLIDSGIAKNFWVEAINTACYLSDEGIFLGYSSQRKAYKIYNKRTQYVGESVHVIFDESYPSYEKNIEEDQVGEPLLVPSEVIDMANGKVDMMSQVKEMSEDNTVSSSMEPGTSITTTKAEERVVDAVQGTPLALERRTQENQSNVYVDDIISGATVDSLCEEFAKLMGSDSFNLIGYANADYAGYLVDRKSTSRMAHFLGSCHISWGIRKQNSVALSIAEAKYVAATSCCAQLLWINQQLEDFGVLTESVSLLCDNTSALNMAKNPVQHKRTKHINVRHHFLRDNVEKGLICMKFCSTEDQIADIFTKALRREHFERNRVPTNQRPNGEQVQNPEVTEGSTIVATNSVMEIVPIEEENVVTIFVVSADGVLHKIISQKNEVQGMGDEGSIVTVEGAAPADTTGPSHVEPNPSPEDPGQGSHSQDSSAPAFAVVPLEIQAPDMRSSDEEDLDNLALKAFIVKQRVVSTLASSTK